MLVSNFFLIFTRFLLFNQDTTWLFQISFKVRNLSYTWCFKLGILLTMSGFINSFVTLIADISFKNSVIIHTCPSKLLSRLSHKVCRLLSPPVLLRKFTNIWRQMTPSFSGWTEKELSVEAKVLGKSLTWNVLFPADYFTFPMHVDGFPMGLCGSQSVSERNQWSYLTSLRRCRRVASVSCNFRKHCCSFQ